MKSLVYLHDGKSVYDGLFLKTLSSRFDVTLATFAEEGIALADRLGVKSVKLHDIMKPRKTAHAMFLAPFRVREVRKLEGKFNLVVASWATTYGYYCAAAGLKPYALIVWGSDVLIQPKYPVVKGFAKRALKEASLTVVDSEVQEKAVMALGGHDIMRFPWFDLADLDLEQTKEEARRKIGLAPEVFTVIYDRGFSWVYDPLTVVRSLGHFADEDTLLLMAGNGRLEETAKREAAEIDPEFRYIHFLGRLERKVLLDYVRASDVYVSTSRSNGTSACLLEAMALGVAPVVTDIPANKEWVTHLQNGIIFPLGGAERLGAWIKVLRGDSMLRKRLAEEAGRTVAERIDWAGASRRFLDAVEGMG